MVSSVVVAGVGMIPFRKPGSSAPYHVMGAQAARLALADAGLDYDAVQQAYAGFVYGDSTSGQRALYDVGMTGIPIVNVNNNCSSGSTALFLARAGDRVGLGRLRAGPRLRADARVRSGRCSMTDRACSSSSTPPPIPWWTLPACPSRYASSAARG